MFRFPPKRIVVPMDVSEPSLSALNAAKDIARRYGSSLELVYVQDIGFNVPAVYPDGIVAAMPNIVKMKKEFCAWCAHKLKEAAQGFPPSRIHVRTFWGLPGAKLADIARGRSADLVVMGTHGYAGLERAIYGSVAEAVVRRATIPVLTVHRRVRPLRLKRILVPCNMTAYADKALLYALDLARALRAKVEVLYVAPQGSNRSDLEKLRSHVRSVLKGRGPSGLRLRVMRGDPRHAIVQHARRGKFDAIVLSAHRRPFSSDFVVGSTVERVLRHSTVPVFAVPSVGAAKWVDVQLFAGGVPTNKLRLPV